MRKLWHLPCLVIILFCAGCSNTYDDGAPVYHENSGAKKIVVYRTVPGVTSETVGTYDNCTMAGTDTRIIIYRGKTIVATYTKPGFDASEVLLTEK